MPDNKVISPPEFEKSQLYSQINTLKTETKLLKRTINHLENFYRESFDNECFLDDKLSTLNEIISTLETTAQQQKNESLQTELNHAEIIKEMQGRVKGNNKRLLALLVMLLISIATTYLIQV